MHSQKLNITSEFNEVAEGDLGKMRAKHSSVKFLLNSPNGTKWSESAMWSSEGRSREKTRIKCEAPFVKRIKGWAFCSFVSKQ